MNSKTCVKLPLSKRLNISYEDQLLLCAGQVEHSAILLTVILLPAHPASFAHKFLFQRVPGCNSIADLLLKIVFWTHKFAVGTH